MAHKILMPKLGLTAKEATLNNWLVDEGERVSEGQAICEIETGKALVEVEAPTDGILLRKIEGGLVVPTGQPIGVIGEPGEDVSGFQLFDPSASRSANLSEDEVSSRARPRERPGRRRASPVARRIAEDLGVDLSNVTGTGPGGRIRRKDVEMAAENMNEESPETQEPSQMRKTIAKAMIESAGIPQFALERDLDVTALQNLLGDLPAEYTEECRPTIADAIALALARVLTKHQAFMRSWADGKYVLHRSVTLGLAVAVSGGLVVPVVREANLLSLSQMAQQRRQLQERAKAGRLSAGEMSAGVFTLSNLGPLGVDRFLPLVNPPESGILGVGRVKEDRGRQMITLTLVADHRVVDGAHGAALLADIAELLEEPVASGLLDREDWV